MIHDLKIEDIYFDDILVGRKRFEVRLNDRDYSLGDVLRLKCKRHERRIELFVDYIHSGLGLEKGYMVLGFSEFKEVDNEK
jgi:ASC-1-like (ASCH) protein